MNSPIYPNKKSYSIGTWFFIIFSMSSLLVAITSVVYTTKTNMDRDRISIIDSINEDILHLNTMLIQNPHLHHLVASREDYPRVSELVIKSLDKTTSQRMIELILTEETMAISLLNLYERVLLGLDHARSMKDTHRIEFLKDRQANFEQDLLLNPRMLFLFQKSLEHFSPRAREYYDHRVNSLGVTANEQDDTGPIMHALKRIDPQFSSP